MNTSMILQVLDSNGNAVARKRFWKLSSAEGWLNDKFPNLDAKGYSVEIFYE